MMNWDAVTIEEISPPFVDLDREARRLFANGTDEIEVRDRNHYRSFGAMPPSLQQWWRHRVERKVKR